MNAHSQHAISVGREYIEKISDEDHGSQTEYILSFINSGSIKLLHRDVIELTSDMFTLVPAGMPHSVIEGKNLDVWWVSFCPNCLGFNENEPLMHPFRQVRLGALPSAKLDEKRSSWLRLLFTELEQALRDPHPDYLEVYKSLLILILHEVEKATRLADETTTTSNKVVAALDYIQQYFLEPISLKDVAKAIHSSPSHLATLVKSETGYSVGEWITRNRLTEACSRLLHTSKPIGLIVEELGWNDTTHFIRQFKKAYGQTPAAWRKQQKLVMNGDERRK